MKKTKILFLLLTSMLLITGCGDEKEEKQEVEISKTYEVGEFSVDVPKGWIEAPFYENGTENTLTDVISLYKSEKDVNTAIFESPGISIAYREACSLNKGFYEDSKDEESVTIGEIKFDGFSTDNSGYPMSQYIGDFETGCIDIMLMQDRKDGTVNIDDEEIKVILESIELTE